MKIIKTHDLGENVELRIVEITTHGNFGVNVWDLDVNQPLSFGYLCKDFTSAEARFTKIIEHGLTSIIL
jgi:hypothetical protein